VESFITTPLSLHIFGQFPDNGKTPQDLWYIPNSKNPVKRQIHGLLDNLEFFGPLLPQIRIPDISGQGNSDFLPYPAERGES